MNSDPLFSDDVQLLRQEIVRLRSFLDVEFKNVELLRAHNEHLKSIIDSLISHSYGKSI